MEKWEYWQFILDGTAWVTPDGKSGHLDWYKDTVTLGENTRHERQEEVSGPDFSVLLNTLGEEGWEFIGPAPGWSNSVLFKRRKDNWEYFTIYVHGLVWADSDGDSGELESVKGLHEAPNIVPMLDDLGAEGWEISGVSSSSSADYQLFLKRKVSD